MQYRGMTLKGVLDSLRFAGIHTLDSAALEYLKVHKTNESTGQLDEIKNLSRFFPPGG